MSMLSISETVRRETENRTGILSGFPSIAELARLHHTVILDNLFPEALTYRRFRFVFNQCVAAAARISPLEFRHVAIYAGGVRAGYEFRFPTLLAAFRFRICYDAAINGKPCPTVQVRS